MNWPPSTKLLPAHLERFTEELRLLSSEVRSSAAGLAGDAVGRAVRDILLRFWQKSTDRPLPEHRPFPQRPDRERWEQDEWDRDEEWQQPEAPAESSPSVRLPRLAMLIHAAGTVLEYSPWLLLAAAIAVGGFALLGGQIGVAGFDLLNKVADLASLLTLLSTGAKHLGSF